MRKTEINTKDIIVEELDSQAIKKAGRPKKTEDKKKSKQIFISVTEKEKEIIEAYADDEGISAGALIRQSLKKMEVL